MKNKQKMIISDMDGTIVAYNNFPFNSSWDQLYAVFGLSEENNKLLREYYDKRDSEKEWTDKQVGLLKGLPLEKALNGLLPVPYSKGAKSFFLSLDKEYIKGILTTGINLVADVVEKELNLDFSLSNILHHTNKIFTGTYEARVWLWKKADKLKEISSQFKIALENICFIGDNENDIPCFEIVGMPVAFNPKTKETRNNARYTINDFSNLNEILKNF